MKKGINGETKKKSRIKYILAREISKEKEIEGIQVKKK
jgi:hypothetical protein